MSLCHGMCYHTPSDDFVNKYVVISELEIFIDQSKWGSVTKNSDNYKSFCNK